MANGASCLFLRAVLVVRPLLLLQVPASPYSDLLHCLPSNSLQNTVCSHSLGRNRCR